MSIQSSMLLNVDLGHKYCAEDLELVERQDSQNTTVTMSSKTCPQVSLHVALFLCVFDVYLFNTMLLKMNVTNKCCRMNLFQARVLTLLFLETKSFRCLQRGTVQNY